MEINFKAEIQESSFSKVPISYPDLMYAAQNFTPTTFKIYLYIICHPNRIVTRTELLNNLDVDNGQLYKSRVEMTNFSAGALKGSEYTCFNTIFGGVEPYVPNWL